MPIAVIDFLKIIKVKKSKTSFFMFTDKPSAAFFKGSPYSGIR